MVGIREAQDTDIDHVLRVRLVLEKDSLKAVDSSACLRDDIGQDVDVDVGRLENVIVSDQGCKPRLDLRTGKKSAQNS